MQPAPTITSRRRRFAARTLMGAIGASCLALPMLARADCQVKMLELPVKMVGSRAVATVGINGTPTPLTVDSGAFYSTLTDAAAEQLGLQMKRLDGLRVEGLTGRVVTRRTLVDTLQLVNGDIPKVEFIVGGNEPGAGTMGLMGRNLLAFADTEYDLAHGMIRFFIPNDGCAGANMAYWAGTTPVNEVEVESQYGERVPAIRAKVKLNGRELMALFDTGASTIVALNAARRAGVADADMTPAGTMYGAGRGRAREWTAGFERFELGGEAISHNRLNVGEFDSGEGDMLLGIDYFLSHRIYVSKKQSKMYITYNGGPVFALNRSEHPGAVPFDADPAASGPQAITAEQYARRGASLAARRDFAGALADLDQACTLGPASAAFLAQRGTIQEALRHPEMALADFDKALEIDPAQADARLRRAALRLRAKDRDGAQSDLDLLGRTIPSQSQMRLALARAYMDLEQPAHALPQLDQWLAAHPNEARRDAALNSRCWARAMLGVELDRALDDCNEALDSDAKNAAYLDSRGWVYLRLGKYRQAVADFDRSIEVQPRRARAFYGRGLAKTRLGEAAPGDADLAAARSLQSDVDARIAHAGLPSLPSAGPSSASSPGATSAKP